MWLLGPTLACVASILLYLFHAYLIQGLIPEVNPGAMLRVSAMAIAFSVAWFISRLADATLMRKGKGKRRRPKLLRDLITGLSFTIATVAAIAILLGHSTGGVLASSGLIIAVLGFAIRNVLADVLSGIAIGLEAPFRIGDWVEFDETTSGRVIEIGWRTTRVLTPNDTYMILPNSKISKLMLTNYSAPRKHYRATLQIVLGHEISVANGKNLLMDAAQLASTQYGGEAAQPPVVRATSYDADGVTYTVKYWVPSYADDLDCLDAVLGAIDKAVRIRGLSAPRSSKLRAASPEEKVDREAERSA